MNFLAQLARQPLFRLLAAIVVLLLVDYNLPLGIFAAVVWMGWIYWGIHIKKRDLSKGW